MNASPTLLERYQQATALSIEQLPGLLWNRRIEPVWTGEGDQFWYRRETADGDVYVLVDPLTGQRSVADTLESLGLTEAQSAATPGLLPGPDGRALRARDDNLWLVDSEGSETQLTKDGEPAYAWGGLPEPSLMAVPFKRMGLVLPPLGTLHSPSGRRVLTSRSDQRAVTQVHLVENVVTGGRPECHEIRMSYDDDPRPTSAEARIIDLDTGASVDVDTADGLADMLVTNGACEAMWSADESKLYLLNRRQGSPSAALVEVDVETGARRDVLTLDEAPLYEPNQFLYSLPLVRVLPLTNEVVLFSQRDGWGHLYLYDLTTGVCKNQVSNGAFTVRDILDVDETRREITYVGGTDADGCNPLWRRVYRAGLDGGTQQLLTPEPADHELAVPEPQFFQLIFGQGRAASRSLSPSGRFFVDHQSTVSQPPVILLRDASKGGAVVLELERTDISRLLEAGYVVPQEVCVKADDGVTDLWGVVSLPSRPIDPERIPVVEHVYAGFQMTYAPLSFVGGGSAAGGHANLPALNALGFAAVIMDGRGTPGRDRAFRQWTHGRFHTREALVDHVTFLEGLGAQHPSLDLSRVGVVGHSFGGYNAARLLLLFPDAFKAAVSSAAVHDPRKTMYDSWAWQLGADYDRTSETYRQLGNLHLAEQLQGDLLLAAGEIDENATVDHAYAMAQALMSAGKRFDFKVWPGLNHYAMGPYVHMAFWDHFVRSLHGVEPPLDYQPGA
jgi:pimeloyl-ACP methyl ester carboxylesterase